VTIGIVDPGSGNITSLCDAVARLGLECRVLKEPDLNQIERLILPGQGRFGAVMANLGAAGWDDALVDWARAGQPLVGICVGMQVLFESSEEDPGVAGLGLLPGEVRALDGPKRPMMGWGHVAWRRSPLTVPDGSAYFVNGYAVAPGPATIAVTHYASAFAAAVARDNIIAFQFHPEKSGRWGQELMKQCLTC
jgi:imidazole glycerol phosphate synthase glutamine amidotransferase subunit